MSDVLGPNSAAFTAETALSSTKPPGNKIKPTDCVLQRFGGYELTFYSYIPESEHYHVSADLKSVSNNCMTDHGFLLGLNISKSN